MVRGVPDDYYPDDLEEVPTASALAKQKLAVVLERNGKGEVTVARPTPEGQALIYEIMARNSERTRAAHERRQREAAQDDSPDQ